MSRFRLEAHAEGTRVLINVTDNGRAISTLNVTRAEYVELARTGLVKILQIVAKTISEELGEMIWSIAVSAELGNSDRAKQMLLELGLTQAAFDRFAQEISIKVGNRLTEAMP